MLVYAVQKFVQSHSYISLLKKYKAIFVKKNRSLYHINVLVVLMVCISCATPIAPTGGPRDSVGPKILETNPETGTTNFKGRKFEFQFNEYVNRTSLNGNINIEPDLDLEYSVKWKKKKLIIEFESELPDSSTVILTLGSKIKDTKNNEIGVPITIAVSTGDEIDDGSIIGGIRSAEDGSGEENLKVLLYRMPVDLNERANYQAETDTGGVFRFSYLGEGDYKAFYVDDRNRNKIWDQNSESAQSFNREILTLEKEGKDTLDVLYLIKKDTLAPKLQGVGLFSSQRLRLRFNENIVVDEDSKVAVFDSLGNSFSSGYPLYISKDDPFVLFAQTEVPLAVSETFTINFEGVGDGAGNPVLSDDISFEGSAQVDTTNQRIIENKTESGLLLDQSVEIVYAGPISDPMIFDSTVVVEGELSFDDWPNIRAEGNVLFIDPQDSWIEGVEYQFLIWNPATQRRKLFKMDIWDAIELGEIEVSVESADSSIVYHYQLENEKASISIDSVFTQNILIENLLPLSYRLRVYQDINGNGIWDEGSVSPYAAPEPYYIRKNVKVQTGFTSEVIIQF